MVVCTTWPEKNPSHEILKVFHLRINQSSCSEFMPFLILGLDAFLR